MVITIIGILIALLLPAVQAAREAARRLECQNHLKQLSLACLSHEQAHGWFPASGWMEELAVGDPDLGFDAKQPGGWLYNLLPYIEQQAMHDIGMGMTAAQKKPLFTKRVETPLGIVHCPSRRPPLARPFGATQNHQPSTCDTLTLTAKMDYAINLGADDSRPTTGIGDCGRNLIHVSDVTDGLSNTYLVGEKYLSPDAYENGMDGGDDDVIYSGPNTDNYRFTGMSTPLQDRSGYGNDLIFGSAHATGCNMAMCDGSVQSISYSIEAKTHRYLGSRADGMAIDAKKL